MELIRKRELVKKPVPKICISKIHNKKIILLYCLLFAVFSPVFSQNTFLVSEIERMEKLAEDPAQASRALVNMAQLYQLSGNREKACEVYFTASAASPQKRDDRILLEAVKLLISMGEFDKAGAELRTILISARDTEVRQSALLINAQLEAFKTGDCGPLGSMADDPDGYFSGSGVLYTLWKISEDDLWKAKLLSFFPRSIEAGIAGKLPGIDQAMTVQWLLLPARTAYPAAPVPGKVAETAAENNPALQSQAAAVQLQTGLFNREDNAKKMAEDLAKAGFSPVISWRLLGGADYWAVHVPAGGDVNRTINQLKNAGYESFPVFN